MAYTDIVPDSSALIALELNGNFNNTGYQTQTSVTLPTAYSFANEHPFDATKQSLKISSGQTGSSLTGVLNNGSNISTARGTIEFWFKYTAAGTGVIASNTVATGLRYFDSTYGDIRAVGATFTGGTSYATSGVGHISGEYRSGTTFPTRSSSYKYGPNQWHCVHLEVRADIGTSPTNSRMYMYVNGLLDNTTSTGFSFGANTGISGYTISLPTLTVSGQTYNIAEFRYFPTRLTKEQKVLRAKYGTATIGYEPTVLADTPEILLKMDNLDKTTPVTIYGANAAYWGGELAQGTVSGKGQINYGSQISFNQTGPKNDKAWKWNLNGSGSGWIANVTAAKMQELWRDNTKSLTFEWLATSPSYDPAVGTNAAANVLRFNPATGGGRMTAALSAQTATPTSSSIGQILPTLIEYWNTTTSTFTTGSLSNLGGDVASNNQTNYSQFADDQWHHHVITFDRSTTNLKVYYWIDGWLSRWRDFGVGTNIQYTLINDWGVNVNWFFGPDNNPITTTRTMSFDNFAVYNKMLTNEQIRQHYYAYAAAEPVPTSVKAWNGTTWVDSIAQNVWNGTAWVPWAAKRYDGSSWISI